MGEPSDNPELTNTVASIDATLKDMHTTGIAVASSLQFLDDDLKLMDEELARIRQSAFPPPRPRAVGSWPWAPGTVAQGFLGSRWNRRDGNVYATAVRFGGPNSPIAGGQDAKAKVSVLSGVPKQR